MDWLKDPAWRLGVAIMLVVAGTVLSYHGAAGTDDLGAIAMFGFALFCIGMAVPLVSQVLGARRESTGKGEDV